MNPHTQERNEVPGEALPYRSPDELTSVQATELRTHMRKILEQARYQNGQFLVCTHGQPMAVLLGVDEYLQLRTAAERGNLPDPL